LADNVVIVNLRAGRRREVRLAGSLCPKGVDAFGLAPDPNRGFVVCRGVPLFTLAEVDLAGPEARVVASAQLTRVGIDMRVVVNRDGRFVVVGGFLHFGSGFELFESHGGRLRQRTSQEQLCGLRAAAFGPDGRTFATAFGNGKTQLWHIGTNNVRSE